MEVESWKVMMLPRNILLLIQEASTDYSPQTEETPWMSSDLTR